MTEKIKILIIDDNPDDRFLMIRELKKEFDILTEEVIDETDFLEALKNLPYDVVITDYQLRWTTGLEILRRIKKINPHQPIIMFTGSAGEEIAVEAMKVGLDDYIIKSQKHYMRIPIAVKGILVKKAEQEKRLRAEKMQNIAYNVADAVNNTHDLNELFVAIKAELSSVIETSNFFIALYDSKKDELTLPFIIDEKDSFKSFPAGKTLTAYVIKNDKSILVNEEQILELARNKEIELIGSPSKVWLGVPLKTKEKIIGALAVQSYTDKNAFTFNDLEMLQYITNQVAISIDRKQSENALIQSEEHNKAILQAIPDLIFVYDKDGRYVDFCANNTKELYMPYPEIKGKYIYDVFSKELSEKILEVIKNCLETKEMQFIEYDLVINDEKQYYESRYVPLSDNEVLGISRNITQSKLDHLETLKSKLRAEESDKLKTAFLANMSHEIRTPMNAIIGFSSLLSEKGISNEEKNEYIQLITENGNVLLNLINDIIDIAKIEAGEIQISESTCQLNGLMSNLYDFFKSRNTEPELEIKVIKDVSEPDFSFLTDGLRLRQVITNLIGNALKFTKKGYIEFGYQIQGDKILFFVKDTGIGISTEKQEVIFDRFRQADDSFTRKFGGTGLGLTISKNLVKLMGGDIWVKSEINKGAEFYFTLPYKKSQNIKKYDEPEITSVQKTTIYQWKDKTILIAEDVDSNYQFVEAVLRKTGVRLIWVKDGVEAVEICRKDQSIDVILMDIQMPIMNGYEATRQIKSFRPNLPIISQTAYAMLGERELSVEAGCDNYLSKPIRPGELLTTLAKYL